ncbi:MAG: hypothetical protein JRN62_08880 [Nitrososphaerota archaeon]|nr:hypothetical protein [Nitrososphaerota archaeon]
MAETLLAVWKRNCWKCGEKGTVVLDVISWPFALGGEFDTLWRDHIPPHMLKILGQGANIQFKRTRAVKEGYYANVCSRCGVTQGDFFLYDEFPVFLEEEHPKDFELVLIKDGALERRFGSVPEATVYFRSRNP